MGLFTTDSMSTAFVVLALTALLNLALLVKSIVQRRKHLHAVATEHDCQTPRYDNASFPLGIRKAWNMVRQYQKRNILPNSLVLFRELGDTYVSRIVGMDVVFTCNPDNIKHVLQRRFDDFEIGPLRRHLFVPVTPDGIFGYDGAEWRAARKLFRVHFADTRSVVDLDIVEGRLQVMMQQRIPTDGQSVDIQALFIALMTDVLGTLAVGEHMDALSVQRTPEEDELDAALWFVKENVAAFGLSRPLSWIGDMIRFRGASKVIKTYIERFVRPATAKNRAPRQPEGEAGQLQDSKASCSFVEGCAADGHSLSTIRDQTTSIYLAGIESAAGLLSSTFWYLSRDNRVFATLRGSVLDRFGIEPPSYDELTSLVYLRHVFNEALRLMPPVPFNAKMANKDTWLPRGGGSDGTGSILIRKGQIVSFWSWASHRNPDVFGADPESFRPERWENIKEDAPGFIPFQPGQRVCPGQRIALTMASYIVIRMLQTYASLEARDIRPWVERHGLGLLSRNGVHVALSDAPSVPREFTNSHRYLIYSYYPKGHFYNMQAVVKALVDRGHQVVWLVSAEHERMVVATGATHIPTRRIAECDAYLIARDPVTALEQARARMRNRVLAEAADYRRALHGFNADCILADVLCTGAQAMYDLGEIPTFASLSGTAMAYSADSCPQWGSGKRPPSSAVGRFLNRARHRLNHWVFYPLVLGPFINPQRARLGLPWLKLGRPAELYTYSPFLHIQASCPEMEYHDETITAQPSQHLQKVCYVGPLVCPSGHPDMELPDWWADAMSHPCVVGVTQGTLATNPKLLIVPTIRALATCPQVMLIVMTPYADELRAQVEMPDNVHLAKWVPYHLLFPKLRILITNGGYGGINQALTFGVPLICAGRTEDHTDTSARVAWIGAGVDLQTSNPSPKQMKRAVDAVLEDDRYRRNARRVGDELLNLGGATKACEALEELVKETRLRKGIMD
ncbi:cytochrome P450 [Diplogelasinospora grovesii]|uniref:Cytochrome P450 n=1 Tax=Diplogelasinospora grovesii TaxID=303347 RepID=A0AAN6S0D7_9PEZI|nr:cytochrome P450 [Diplogelasinospora grovesii]